jgi:hypothetical protein
MDDDVIYVIYVIYVADEAGALHEMAAMPIIPPN